MSLPSLEILAEFQKASQASRYDFLTKLSSHFHSSDWHHLHNLLAAHSCYIDFLTALPIEISLNVLQYLSPIETLLLRAVSRGYYNLLTSPEICRFLSNSFFPRCGIPAGSSRIHYENIISRRLSFRRGWPTRFEEIPDSGPVVSFCASTSTLASVVGDTLRVHLLTTSPPTLLLPPKRTSDRTHPTHSILTSAIVAVASYNGNCQIWDLSTHATHTIRLHSVPKTTNGSGYILAMVIRNDLLVHDAALKKTKLFERVLPGLRGGPIYLIVHEPTRRVWVIDVNFDDRTTAVMALCLDTGAVVVPVEVFNRAVSERLTDVGSGVWKLGSWDSQLDDSLEAIQLHIDVGRTAGAVRMQKFPALRMAPDRRKMLSPVMDAESWGTDEDLVIWGDMSWACMSRCAFFPDDQIEGIYTGPMLNGSSTMGTGGFLRVHAVCEEFLVVENMVGELGIFRFEGVHERLAGSAMVSSNSVEGWIGKY